MAPIAPVLETMQAPAGRSHLKRNAVVLILVALFVVAAAVLLFGGGLLQTQHSVVIAGGYAVIPEGHYTETAFSVPAGASQATVSGTFTASGDFNNQITVLIMSQSDFQSWQQGTQIIPNYDSGQVSGATVNVQLPSGENYVVVFYDTFTGAASTVITGQLTLTYKS